MLTAQNIQDYSPKKTISIRNKRKVRGKLRVQNKERCKIKYVS